MYLLHICLEIPERNRAESSPKIIRAKPWDKPSPADRAELRVQSEPRANFEPQVKPESSRIKHRGEQRFESSRFPNKAEPAPDPESGLEPSRVPSQVPSLESSLSRSDAWAEPNRASSHAEQGFEPIQPSFESSLAKPRVRTQTEPNWARSEPSRAD